MASRIENHAFQFKGSAKTTQVRASLKNQSAVSERYCGTDTRRTRADHDDIFTRIYGQLWPCPVLKSLGGESSPVGKTATVLAARPKGFYGFMSRVS